MIRLRLAYHLMRCALFHEIITLRGWLRCPICNPIRRRKIPAVKSQRKEGVS